MISIEKKLKNYNQVNAYLKEIQSLSDDIEEKLLLINLLITKMERLEKLNK